MRQFWSLETDSGASQLNSGSQRTRGRHACPVRDFDGYGDYKAVPGAAAQTRLPSAQVVFLPEQGMAKLCPHGNRPLPEEGKKERQF